MLTITILILSIATPVAISQHLWNPTNGFLNITSLPLSYSKTRDASLKVVKWEARVGYYYLSNNERQTICLHKELFLTANKTSDKSCIWRIECKRRGRIIYKRLFVENESDLSCKKFYLGQGCSSNYDDSLFLLRSEPQCGPRSEPQSKPRSKPSNTVAIIIICTHCLLAIIGFLIYNICGDDRPFTTPQRPRRYI